MNNFFAEIEPFHSQMLAVGDGHQLYVEQCGNPKGQPVVFIHGGPGGGCSSTDRRFFDPERYHIVLFDQRGCGRSVPHGSLEDNETSHLVADLEVIRQHFNFKQWHVFGGSWGSTLALVYAQNHPDSVTSLVLRGIFLGRRKDTMWTFTEEGGAARLFPEYWQEYLSALPQDDKRDALTLAYEIMTGPDKVEALKVAKAWSKWEISCCTLVPNEEYMTFYEDDDSSWTLARHESHYMINDCFIEENEILDNCHKIADIPTVIVHGRYDIVCPLDNAWLLHQQMPHSELIIAQQSGHASVEPEITHHLVAATNKMLAL